MEMILFWKKNQNKIADGRVSEEPSSQANNSLQAINMASQSIMKIKEKRWVDFYKRAETLHGCPFLLYVFVIWKEMISLSLAIC